MFVRADREQFFLERDPGVNTGGFSLEEEIAEIISRFSIFSTDIPYGRVDFELESSIGERKRGALVEHLVSLGKHGSDLFRASSDLRQISDDEASHKALETIYTGPIYPDTDLLHFWSQIHIGNIHNAMAARNRLRIVKNEFTGFMGGLLKDVDKVDVLSIAAGSSRGIMEVLRELNGRGHDHIRLRMVDINRDALADGKNLVKELDIQESVDFIRAHFLSFRRYLETGYRPHFVEIVGLFDYLPDNNVVTLLSAIRSQLAEGGMILFSNIDNNDEEHFTHQVVGWRSMQYRPKDQLVSLAENAGFGTGKIRAIEEPLGIYNLIAARR